MNGLSAVERGDMAVALLPEAAGLIVDVHEGAPDDIRARLAGLTRHELEGLAVVLAGLADPERSLRDALGWLTFDEHGEPDAGVRRAPAKPIRDVVSNELDRARVVDRVLVDRALAPGPRVRLSTAEQRMAVDVGLRSGMTYADVAERLEMRPDSVKTTWERLKKRARVEGRSVPSARVGQIRDAA